VWLGADEIGVPALGLSGPPTQYPLSVHLYALASHLVYGFTTELVRRTLRRGWGARK
jgi:putative membrane protein